MYVLGLVHYTNKLFALEITIYIAVICLSFFWKYGMLTSKLYHLALGQWLEAFSLSLLTLKNQGYLAS